MTSCRVGINDVLKNVGQTLFAALTRARQHHRHLHNVLGRRIILHSLSDTELEGVNADERKQQVERALLLVCGWWILVTNDECDGDNNPKQKTRVAHHSANASLGSQHQRFHALQQHLRPITDQRVGCDPPQRCATVSCR